MPLDILKRKERIPDDVLLRVDGISKNFGPVKALQDVSFEVRRGEVLGLLGPNGAGKTTTMRILTGFFPPSRGKVWINGQELFRRPEKTKRFIGYLPEQIALYGDMKVIEFLKFVAAVKRVPFGRRKAHIDQNLVRCGLWNVRKRIIGQLSKGYRQRVGLAQALLGDPDVLVLDEPTTGLDPKQINEIRSLIKELGKDRTLILSTHILPEVSMVCDRVLIMNGGRVQASGTTDELEADVKDWQEIFVTIGDPSRKEDALNILKTMTDVQRIREEESNTDTASFALNVGKGKDLRAIISRAFVEKQIPLLEIRSSKLSLEEIFLKLTVNEGGVKTAS